MLLVLLVSGTSESVVKVLLAAIGKLRVCRIGRGVNKGTLRGFFARSESRACTVRLTLLFGFIWDRLPRRIMWLKTRCEYTARIGLNGTGAADRFVAYKLCVMVRVAFSRDHVSKHLSMAFWDAR